MTLGGLRWALSHGRRQVRRTLQEGYASLTGWPRFWLNYAQYQRLACLEDRLAPRYLQPCLGDDTAETQIEPIYFYQDAWAFEKIVQQCPTAHVDVGSHHKFVALLSKVVPVTMVDIRPLSLPLETLRFQEGSILNLPYSDQSVTSLSSLCVIEHIGLGRYGDPLDAKGSVKAITELKRIVAPGGYLYVSVPLDEENRTYFNAHRAFQEEYLLGLFQPFEVVERRYIFGNMFGAERCTGFGTGCYQLRRPQ